MDTLSIGIQLMSKLLSRLSPNFSSSGDGTLTEHSHPPSSPIHHQVEHKTEIESGNEENNTIPECVRLSKKLFSVFVDMRVMKKKHSFLSAFHFIDGTVGKFESVELCNKSYDRGYDTADLNEEKQNGLVAKAFQIFCRYLVQLSCFPVSFAKRPGRILYQVVLP